MMMSAYANILKVTDIDRLDILQYQAGKLITCAIFIFFTMQKHVLCIPFNTETFIFKRILDFKPLEHSGIQLKLLKGI